MAVAGGTHLELEVPGILHYGKVALFTFLIIRIVRHGWPFCRNWLRDESTLHATWRRRLPDAIVCSSDLVAANVLKLLPQIGKRCPDDVLVTGVNDVDLATLVSPTLTTVHQPCEAIAQTAFETLLWRMENPTTEPRRIMVATSLVVRDSTRAGQKR